MSQGKSQSAEILLKSNGGRIWTGAEQAPWVESVAINGGKVVATGSLEEMTGLLGAETEIIDVENGKLLIPGIIDAHLHIVMGG
ncbi:MAG: amidohydrolase, partial [Planctomycetota bacterium]